MVIVLDSDSPIVLVEVLLHLGSAHRTDQQFCSMAVEPACLYTTVYDAFLSLDD